MTLPTISKPCRHQRALYNTLADLNKPLADKLDAGELAQKVAAQLVELTEGGRRRSRDRRT